jgi:tetratricopeptide (TPR) repeat protein
MLNTKAMTAKDWYDRGNESKRCGNHTAALDYYKQSIKLNPKVAAPWIGIAKLLDSNSQFEEARQCFMHAVVADPNYLMARQMLAASHQKLGYVAEAEREYKHAIRLKPDADISYLGLGQLFEDLGKPDQAAEAYRKAMQCAPNKQDALANLLGLSKQVDVANEIAQAKRILVTLKDREKALVGYGLGKAYQQEKNYQAAFNAFEIANNARQSACGIFNRKAFDNRIDKLINLFSKEFFAARKNWGNGSERPVFIVGLPRSGTTLTEQILASHPQCFGAGELNVLTDLATGTPDRIGSTEREWPETAQYLTQTQILQLAEDYLTDSGKRAPEHIGKVVDKQPLNFWHLGLVALAFPNARIVHCTRDIRDCGLSIYTQNFNETQNWSTDLDDIAYYWQGYKKLMAHFQAASTIKIFEVNYEDTVADIAQQSKRLLDFVGLTWDEQVLSFHETDRAVQTPSRWQVRQPLYKSSKARWRNYASYLWPLIKAAEK